MDEKNLIEQNRLPLLRDLEFQTNENSIFSDEAKHNTLNLTIFYFDNSGNRTSFSCRAKPRHYVGPDGQEMLIAFEYQGESKAISLPLNTMVGDLVAFIMHSVVLCNLSPNEKWSNTDILLHQLDKPYDVTNNDEPFIDILDCQCTIGDLLFKSKNDKLIAIRNFQFHLCALISKESNELTLRYDREVMTLLDIISEEMSAILRSKSSLKELEKLLNSRTFAPQSNEDRWNDMIYAFNENEVWQSLKLIVDHALFMEMLNEMKRIVNILFSNKRIELSENDNIILMETAIFFDKMKEMRA